MVRLEYFDEEDFQQLINWIPNKEFCLQWGGPGFTYPLTNPQLTEYIKDTNKENAIRYI